MFGKKITIPAALVIIAAFSGCFSPWQGDEAVITLYLSGVNNRAVTDDNDISSADIINLLEHKITLSGPAGVQTESFEKGTTAAQLTVAPGRYEITVEAFLDPEDLEKLIGSVSGGGSNETGSDFVYEETDGQTDFGEFFELVGGKYLIARGSASVVVIAGQSNPVEIKMEWAVPSEDDLWGKYDIESTAILEYEVDADGVCKITITGKPEPNVEGNFQRYKASVYYNYTAKADTAYVYEIEAWTQEGTRTINIQYYYDETVGAMLQERTIHSTPTTYRVVGEKMPQGGTQQLAFQGADKLGTYYVRIRDIREAKPGDEVPENWLDADRWNHWAIPESTATIDRFANNDGLCTITVGGTAVNTGEIWNDIWKTSASFVYTAEAGKNYTFKFEAWTQTGTRRLNVEWYGDEASETYHNTGYDFENNTPRLLIDSTRRTYTITTQGIPKSGVRNLAFFCANQTGTFYVKILSVETYDSSVDRINDWTSWVAADSTANITYSVDNDGLCTITVGGEPMPINEIDEYKAYKAQVQYKYLAQEGKSYTYQFEARTESGERTLSVQYFNDWWDDSKEVRAESRTINETWATYTITGEAIPKEPNAGICELEFQCGDQTGTFYVRNVSVERDGDEPNIDGKAAITISLWEDEDKNINLTPSSNNAAIYKNRTPDSFIASINDGYEWIQWYIGGELFCESVNEITVWADAYSDGIHQLTVVVYKGGVPYSADILFTVVEE